MRYIPDVTRRFPRRPFFEQDELDAECEQIICGFLREITGQVRFPVRTDDLTKLIERDAEDLDLYADLSGEGHDVEGVTIFYPGHKPQVRISRELSEVPWGENRLRTTLTHEYGHVRFHAVLWEVATQNLDLFEEPGPGEMARCHRDTMLGGSMTDWMEWQAGYVSGALLMPLGSLRRIVTEVRHEEGPMGLVAARSDLGLRLVAEVAERFQVSRDAARVRLIQLGMLTERDPGPSIFPQP